MLSISLACVADWWFHLACSVVLAILREAASRGPSALAEILFTYAQLCRRRHYAVTLFLCLSYVHTVRPTFVYSWKLTRGRYNNVWLVKSEAAIIILFSRHSAYVRKWRKRKLQISLSFYLVLLGSCDELGVQNDNHYRYRITLRRPILHNQFVFILLSIVA